MKITSVNIRIAEDTPVLAYCTVVLDGALAIHSIRIIYCGTSEKGDEFKVCMPSMKGRNGKFYDICHPINPETRKKLETAILHAYLGQRKSEVI